MTREEARKRLRGILTEATEFENSVCYVTEEDREPLEMAIQALKQEPCEDVVSRDMALEKMADYVASGYADSAEDFEEYSRIICQLQPVTPQPKIGRWVLKQRDKYIDINCSECGNTRFKDYAYGYTVDELNLEEVKDFIAKNRMNYCECCGIKMQEVEE